MNGRTHDALAPMESLMDANPRTVRQRLQEIAKAGDGWRVPPNPIPRDTLEADVKWISERRLPQSIKCFERPLKMCGGNLTLPRSYVYFTRMCPADTFGHLRSGQRTISVGYYELDASHSAHVTAPEALARLLQTIASSPT